MIQITVNTRRAIVTNKELLTTSSAGIQVQFTFSEDWDELAKFAIFRNGDEGQEVAVALPNSNLTVIPAQSCSEEYVDEPVFVGVYGTDGLGAVAIPTIWTSLGVLRPGAVTTEIITPAEPTPDMWAQILAIANEAMAIADECEENEELRIAAEQLRANAETARANAETLRAQAEAERSRNETQRQSAETQRQTAEDARARAETLRVQAEGLRQANETNRTSAESVRASNERSRQSHELERDSAESLRGIRETERINAEWDRQNAETARASAEISRADAESSRATAEQNRASAETARASAESARSTAESTRASNEQSRVSAEDGRVQAETDRATEFATWESTIASKVPNARTVNGKALSTDITLDSSDIGYDATETYQSGTAGAALNDLSRQLSDETNAIDAKAPLIINTASGDVASFADGADGMPIRKIAGTIVPQQAAGTPSPDNPLPISGWTGANIAVAGKNLFPYETIPAYSYEWYSHGASFSNASNPLFLKGGETYLLSVTPDTGSSANSVYIRMWDTNKVALLDRADILQAVQNTYQYVYYATPKYYYFTQTAISGSVVVTIQPTQDIWIDMIMHSGDGVGNNPQIEVSASVTDRETYHAQTLPINWQSEAGTVYGGTLTLNEDGSADVVATMVGLVLNGTQPISLVNWKPTTNSVGWLYPYTLTNNVIGTGTVLQNIKCDRLTPVNYNSMATLDGQGIALANYKPYGIAVKVEDTTLTTEAAINAYLAQNPIQAVYELATPQTYHIPDVGSLSTYLGTNNVWIDTGSISECDYPADTKLYIDGLTEPDEDMIADANIASGKYFVVNNQLYLSTAAIAAGASIVPGTNCTATNLAEALNALNT